MNRVRSNRAGFTLMELMIVIGLIGLLTLIAIPAFESAGRGGKLRSAAFQLNSTISLARQQAVTTRQTVYVVFPHHDSLLAEDTDFNYSSAPQHVDKAFRAYAIYARRDGYLTEWRMLPQGVIIDPFVQPDTVAKNIFIPAISPRWFIIPRNNNDLGIIPFPDNAGQKMQMYGILFRMDGTMSGSGFHTVYLAEGRTEYDTETGAFDDLFIQEELPYMGISFNLITGQSNIREFDPEP